MLQYSLKWISFQPKQLRFTTKRISIIYKMSRRSIPRDFWEKFYIEYPEYAPVCEDERSDEQLDYQEEDK